MKFPMNKYGLKCDPRHAHVTMPYQGRELLGTVKDVSYDQVCGCYRLTVNYFCGDEWPIRPPALAVNVLERTFD